MIVFGRYFHSKWGCHIYMIKCILLCAFAIHQMDNPVLNVEFIGRKALEEYSSIFRNMLSIRGNENMSWHLEWHSFILHHQLLWKELLVKHSSVWFFHIRLQGPWKFYVIFWVFHSVCNNLQLLSFFLSCMFSFTKMEVLCSQNVNLSNIPVTYSCMNTVSVFRDVIPLELQEDIVRTWAKALESLAVKLVLREVDDAVLGSDRLSGVSQEVLVVTWEMFWLETTPIKQISRDITVMFLNKEWSNKNLQWGLNSVPDKASSHWGQITFWVLKTCLKIPTFLYILKSKW